MKEPTELYLVVFSTFFHVDKSSLLKNKSFWWFGRVFLAPLLFSASKKLFQIDIDIT